MVVASTTVFHHRPKLSVLYSKSKWLSFRIPLLHMPIFWYLPAKNFHKKIITGTVKNYDWKFCQIFNFAECVQSKVVYCLFSLKWICQTYFMPIFSSWLCRTGVLDKDPTAWLDGAKTFKYLYPTLLARELTPTAVQHTHSL
jgi:hypothetical protein